MVTTAADSSSNHHSPIVAAATTTNVPTSNLNFPRKNLPSPWAQVVRGTDVEPPSAAVHQLLSPSSCSSSSATDQLLQSSDPSPPFESSNSDGATAAAASVDSLNADKAGNNAGGPKKPAWRRQSNGVEDACAVKVMDAVSWPALSDSTKPTTKLSPEASSSKTAFDGSQPTPRGPVASHSPRKQGVGNARLNPTSVYGGAGRQRLIKCGGGNVNGNGNGNGNGAGPVQAMRSFSAPPPPPPPPPFPVIQMPPTSFPNGVAGVAALVPRDPYRNSSWGARSPVGSFVPPMIEHRSPSRRGTFGHHPRTGGSFHNYGIRSDQDRQNYAHTRDPQLHPPRMFPTRAMGPLPPNTPSFAGPQPIPPFVNHAGFPEYCYFPTLQFEPFGGMPFFTHGPPSAMFYPVAETSLVNAIVKQIDYYFSDTNLVKDEFLRSNMDDQGFVPIRLVASFRRVKSLTSNVELIIDSLRISTIIEVKGDKLRRRKDWMKWLPTPLNRADFGSTSMGGSSYNNSATDFEKITLDKTTVDRLNSNSITTSDGNVNEESSSSYQFHNHDAMLSSN
ncbi:hypothetical protein HN51_017883 [Arachis hypogaea]|uniref:HTH La-type RNA-binding domain-containing protein n=1 Tax=Arachis hypogaea TaxID=3818 RepID=A0A445BRG4_ARAHY|nr:la-related protein 1C [Arachis hypogaea]QHO29412.1 La-related protein 1C [Arachis hypogaea]RYR41273.1 hypothetical protein Ahy_A08g037683 isoform B [Arachis hypogaea]